MFFVIALKLQVVMWQTIPANPPMWSKETNTAVYTFSSYNNCLMVAEKWNRINQKYHSKTYYSCKAQ